MFQVFPVFYCLMTRKTSVAYLSVFEYIEQNIFKLNHTIFMTDYEDGMRLAVRKYWPKVKILGCWFHLKRAVNRRCRKIGMKRILDRNINARKVKEMLVSIPLLPSSQILEGFENVNIFAARNKLHKPFGELFSYFERYWLKQVSESMVIIDIQHII